MADTAKTFTIEDAQIIFRNFEGKESQYNRKGDRNFAVIIPDDRTAKQMEKDRWNVKYLKPGEEGEPLVPYIQVGVNFNNYPPRVIMLTSTQRTPLDENTIETLDWTNIEKCDIICRAYEWTVGDKTGVKAYLKTMYVTIEEDELDRKYADHGME